MNAQLTFNLAELALASYASLEFGSTDLQRQALEAAGVRMAPLQAEDFAARFPTVITQYADTLDNNRNGVRSSIVAFIPPFLLQPCPL